MASVLIVEDNPANLQLVQRLIARRALARDVKGHVDAIATKYVKPGEGTYDFAFMYLPIAIVVAYASATSG